MHKPRRTTLEYAPPVPRRKDVRIGILGSGYIVDQCHLVSYRLAGFNPVAIASRTPENARRVAAHHQIATVYSTYEELLDDRTIEVLDIAVPPVYQAELIEAACARGIVKGMLAQKPLAMSYAQALQLVHSCERAGVRLAVNQNMRYDPSVHSVKRLLDEGTFGAPVYASIEMRAVPHTKAWQAKLGSATLKIISIHHLDCLRFWFGNPSRVFCSVRPNPRFAFPHTDGICTSILEYDNGLRCVVIDDVWSGPVREGCVGDSYIRWRIEGEQGLAFGDIGWCKDPSSTPSTMRYAQTGNRSFRSFNPSESWFPHAFAGTMGELLVALETSRAPSIGARDNLQTLALVEAAEVSARERRVIDVPFAELADAVDRP